jgi:formylglycine-generating enzyme required for sulfatase activity
MKFVPVPITGGPTDGKKILFSIWETRRSDYEQFVKETRRKWPKPDFEQTPDHPAVNVSWDDAKAFCEWLTLRERTAGKLGPDEQYRLPSDHEWSCAVGIGEMEEPSKSPKEKSGRIPDTYPWGKAWPPPDDAGNYSTKFRDDGYPNTSPVGSFSVNPLGLYDMSGNVAEWCEDWFDEAGKRRVQRGHYYYTSMIGSPAKLSSTRTSSAQDIVNIANGFRCVLAPNKAH